MQESGPDHLELVDALELAGWIIGLSAGTTPEELAGLIRSRLQAVE